jgi:molybdopterin-guanine dinucleotide biosynthesis protein A
MGGGDKPLLEVGGALVLERIIAAVRPDVARLAISANGDPARFAAFGCPVLADETAFIGQGPLAGLCAGLDWAAESGGDCLLSVPGDTPFLPVGLVASLAPGPTFAACAGRDHPLIAVWPVSCRHALRHRLQAQGGRAVGGFAAAIGSRRVLFPSDLAGGFLNLNTPADLTAARARAV